MEKAEEGERRERDGERERTRGGRETERGKETESRESERTVIIIIMYICHALINALGAHVIHINLSMIFYTHVEHSPTKTNHIKYYIKQRK